MRKLIFLMLFISGCPSTVLADAASARQEIEAAHAYIQKEANIINSLAQEKKLREALAKLDNLNKYIESNLAPVFYDKVLEVRREYPGYTPPTVSVSLGDAFTAAFWDAKIAQAEKSLKDATEAMKGVASMRYLNKQDEAWSYLKGVYDTCNSLKDIVEDLATQNYIKLAQDLYEGADGFIENYKAIEEAKLAGLETDAFEAEVKRLTSRAGKMLEKMKDLKSSFTVYRLDVVRFQYNLKNMENYRIRSINDPAFPLDFNNELYNFDIGPYLTSMNALKSDFEAGEFCWEVFEHLYNKIYQEANAERLQITANINASSEPEENKTVYQKDVDDNWAYFDAHAKNVVYTSHADARDAAIEQYNTLKALADAKKTERDAFISSYWDTTGFPYQDLRIFEEEDYNIVQLAISDDPGPYFLGREYSPYFPAGPSSSSQAMPVQTPDIENFSFADYGDGLTALANAYRVMAESGLKTVSNRTLSGGAPFATVAVSPLTQDLMDDMEYNLYRVRDQALDFEAFMKAKQSLIDSAISKQTEVESAETELVSHIQANWSYLCIDDLNTDNEMSVEWDNIIFPVLFSDWNFGDDVNSAIAATGSHISYIQAQNTFNEQMQKSTELLQDLQRKGTLDSLLNFIVNDYNSLPSFPSEQGYKDFLTELDYLHAFYGPASLDSLMDLREEIISLFKNIFSEGTISWFNNRNPYCLMPESVDSFQQLLSKIAIWPDRYIEAARQGFPGWEAWAKSQLLEYWPEGNTDDIRPNVTHFTPGRNSEDVTLYQVIRVSFTEAMDLETFAEGAITVEAKGIERPFKVQYDKAVNMLYLNPGRMLPGTIYTVSLNESVTDLAGNPLVPETWSFSTESIPAGTTPVDIVISGVDEGGAYADPVTITISVSSGGYSATLSTNSEPAEPVVSGLKVSRRGAYELKVTADSGLSRTISFTMGTGTEDYELTINNEIFAADRTNTVTATDYMGVGLRYFVDGSKYYYISGSMVHLFDMVTGEDRTLFGTSYYYEGTGGYKAEPSTICSFLGISGDLILYLKSTGAKGAGLDPSDKTFSLFVYDLKTGKSTLVPSSEGVSLTEGYIKDDAVIWLDSHSGIPAIYMWKAGDAEPDTIIELPGLEYWQRPQILGFDGQWILYKIGDGGEHISQNIDDDIYADYREPLGESLHAFNRYTGESRDLVIHDPENPVRIDKASCSRGLAAYVAYRMHGENSGYWDDTCEESWLSLVRLASGISMPVSFKPHIGFYRFEMTESLLYFLDRVNPPPYLISGSFYTSEVQFKVFDLFTYETFIADLGLYTNRYSLFGDRMISDYTSARVITFGKPISTAAITGQTPAPDATDVSLDSTLTITFSEAMNPETLSSEWIALSRFDSEGNFIERIPLQISYDESSRTLTLIPQSLHSGAKYRVYIGGSVEDAQGKALIQQNLWYFQTADVTGPSLVSSVPVNGSAVMTPGGSVKLVFDEKVDSATATAGIQLKQGDTTLSFTAYSDDSGVLTIAPASPLAYETGYTLTGSLALMDMAGNSLQTPFTLSFSTVGTFTSTLSGSIVYSNGMGTISTINADGSGQAEIAQVSADSVLWGPDQSDIYFGSSNLQVMNADGSGITSIAGSLPWRFTPDFSPDGTRVLYAHQREGFWDYDIVSAALDGSDPQMLYSVPEGSITSVSWSPDRSRIAFVWNRGYNVPVELGILTIATGEAVFLEGMNNPVWSPDGSRIFAQGKLSGNSNNCLVSLTAGLQLDRIICEIPELSQSAISPTGQFMAFFMSSGIYVADLPTGTLTLRLVASAANMGPVRLFWTGDETKLLFNAMNIAGNSSTGAHVLDLVEGNIDTIMTVSGGMPSLPMDWHAPAVSSIPLPISVLIEDISTSTGTGVHLSWNGYNLPEGFSQFRIYRSAEPFTFISEMTPLGTTTGYTFDDTTVEKEKTYYYSVTAVTSDGIERTAVTSFGPIVPGDNDGLDDLWEKHYFGGLSKLPDDDYDGDGLSNLREMQEFTDPTKADTDGDFAPDGLEIELGMNPLEQDVTPLTLSAPATEMEADTNLALVAAGGSGSYSWTVSDTGLAVVSSEGILSSLGVGTVEVTAHDSLFTGLASQPLEIHIVEHLFSLVPAENVIMQRGGTVTVEAVGGSGIYDWLLSGDISAAMEGYGSKRILSSQEENGEFQLIVSDSMRNDLSPLTVTITIGEIPGDVNGDSVVTLKDAIDLMKTFIRIPQADTLFLAADVNGSGRLGMEEVLYIIQTIAGMRD